MATAAQIDANRLNALKSTGPRTDDGKAASRLNALQHGADATLEVIPGEDAGQLQALREAYWAEWRPIGLEQEFLVETLVQADWNRRRYRRIEAQIINHAIGEMEPCDNPLGALFASNTPAARAIERAIRHAETAHRAWTRALHELRKMREVAAENAVFAMMAGAAPGPRPPAPAPVTPSTASAPTQNWVRSAEPSDRPSAPPKPVPGRLDNLALRL